MTDRFLNSFLNQTSTDLWMQNRQGTNPSGDDVRYLIGHLRHEGIVCNSKFEVVRHRSDTCLEVSRQVVRVGNVPWMDLRIGRIRFRRPAVQLIEFALFPDQFKDAISEFSSTGQRLIQEVQQTIMASGWSCAYQLTNRIQCLDWSRRAKTDEDLREVGRRTELLLIDLSHTLIEGMGLQYLHALKRLETLSLLGTGFSSDYVDLLFPLNSLRQLMLPIRCRCRISDLRRELPHLCRVGYWRGNRAKTQVERWKYSLM